MKTHLKHTSTKYQHRFCTDFLTVFPHRLFTCSDRNSEGCIHSSPAWNCRTIWQAARKKQFKTSRELGSSVVTLAGDSQACKVTAVSGRGPAPTDRQYEDKHCRYRVPEPELVFDATYRLLKRRSVALWTQPQVKRTGSNIHLVQSKTRSG